MLRLSGLFLKNIIFINRLKLNCHETYYLQRNRDNINSCYVCIRLGGAGAQEWRHYDRKFHNYTDETFLRQWLNGASFLRHIFVFKPLFKSAGQ